MKKTIYLLILISTISMVKAETELSVSNAMDNSVTIHVQNNRKHICNRDLLRLEKKIERRIKLF